MNGTDRYLAINAPLSDQFRLKFREMAATGSHYHVYLIDGRLSILPDHSVLVGENTTRVVENVQALTEDQLIARAIERTRNIELREIHAPN